jgi:nicotinamidase/pyrazinamidase
MPLDAAKTLLLAIDVQNDFCPEYDAPDGRHGPGKLAVPDGCAVVAPLNALATAFAGRGARVAATQDWHPADHVSFVRPGAGEKQGNAENPVDQVLWPPHCVQGDRGAGFHSLFNPDPVTLIVRKGFRRNLDSYSAFFENDRKTPTGLEGWIRCLGMETVVIGGLATDYCVFYSAMDCVSLGFKTIIAEDAVRGVGYPAGSVETAVSKMREAGIVFSSSEKLLKELC